MKILLFISTLLISLICFSSVGAVNTKSQKSGTGTVSKSSTGAVKSEKNTLTVKKTPQKSGTGSVKTGTGTVKQEKKPEKKTEKTSTGSTKEKVSSDKQNLIEILETEGNFKTFLAAVKLAELTEGIKTKGPFTLFVPNDAAFAKVPKETLDFVMKDKEFLTHILKYHVLGAVLETKDMSKYANAKTAQGSNLPIDTTSGSPKIDGASIVKADIKGKNGIIHVIDSVLMPPVHQ